MKKNKLSFISSAKLKSFTTDDIGKLSINDIKNLKQLFGPKKRKTTQKDYNVLPSNNIRSSSDHMKGYADKGLAQPQPQQFFRGNNNNNTPYLIVDKTDDSRFSNKSNLNIDDVNKAFQNNINPLLDTIRDENKNILINEFMPHLERFKNTTSFIDNNFKNIERDMRDLFSYNQDYTVEVLDDNDDDKMLLNTIYDDDAGNFGETLGSDNFVTLDDKNEKMETLTNEANTNDTISNNNDDTISNNNEIKEKPIDFEAIQKEDKFKNYMQNNIKAYEAVQLYKDLGGTDQNVISARGKGSINKIKQGISNLLKKTYNYNEKAKTNKKREVVI